MLNAGQLRDYCTATNQLDHWYHHQVLINITDMLGQVLAPMGRTLGADAATSAGRVSRERNNLFELFHRFHRGHDDSIRPDVELPFGQCCPIQIYKHGPIGNAR